MGRNRSGDKCGGGGGGSGGPAGYSPPIDHYRRQIAKQDSRKERKHLKSISQSHDAREMAPKMMQQTFLIIATVVGVGAAIYSLLFYSLGRK